MATMKILLASCLLTILINLEIVVASLGALGALSSLSSNTLTPLPSASAVTPLGTVVFSTSRVHKSPPGLQPTSKAPSTSTTQSIATSVSTERPTAVAALNSDSSVLLITFNCGPDATQPSCEIIAGQRRQATQEEFDKGATAISRSTLCGNICQPCSNWSCKYAGKSVYAWFKPREDQPNAAAPGLNTAIKAAVGFGLTVGPVLQAIL